MKRYALTGYPIAHSKSPEFYNKGFAALGIDAEYGLWEIRDSSLLCTLPKEMDGWNVTMPYKQAIMQYCDELTVEAALAGSVNTVVEGVGYTTDGAGMWNAIRSQGIEPEYAVIFGDGGAARSIIAAAGALESIEEIRIFSRECGDNYAQLLRLLQNLDPHLRSRCRICTYTEAEMREELEQADCLVQATCVGMSGPLEGQCLVPDASYLHRELLVAEAIYTPEETKLIRMANACGCVCVTGTQMLKAQARMNFRLFTGLDYPDWL